MGPNFSKQSNIMMDKSASTGTTGVCVSEGSKPEENEAISYYGDGKGGGGGGAEGRITVSFGECHLQALMMIRAAAGVNNIRALKY